MDKLIIEFEKSFWDMSVDWFNFIAEKPGDWAQTLNIGKYLQKPILMMFNADPNTDSFMNLTDKEVLASGLTTLKHHFPYATDSDLQPVHFVRTNWL